MASNHVISMMVEKGAPFSREQLEAMEDRDCWKWVYANHPPKTKRPKSTKPEICFTGFRPDKRSVLESLAENSGFHVVTSVTVKLKFLVTGEAPGPSKLEKARESRIEILSEDDFLRKMTKA